MILQALLTVIFSVVTGLIGLIPEGYALPDWGASAIRLVSQGLALFPADVWQATLACFIFWFVVQNGWALIEWIYKKLPGVS